MFNNNLYKYWILYESIKDQSQCGKKFYTYILLYIFEYMQKYTEGLRKEWKIKKYI